MIRYYLWIGLGGMIGASLRYALSQLFLFNETNFPWDTLAVNLLGAFLLALMIFSPYVKNNLPPYVYPMLTTGILGAFTTFSTIMLETVVLFQEDTKLALTYIMTTFVGGILLSGLAFYFVQNINRKKVG